MSDKIVNTLIHNKNSLSFGKFCIFMMKKDVLKWAKTYITVNHLIKYTNVRIFLSLFMILHFKNNVLDNGELEQKLYKQVKNISENLFNEKYNLQNNVKLYTSLFMKWKKEDKEKQLKVYSETFHELEMLKLKTKHYKNKVTIDEYKNNIEPLQNKILKNTEKFFDKSSVEYIKKYNETHMKFTLALYDKMEKTMKQVFWDNIKLDLSKSPPKFTQIIGVLKDVKKHIELILPKKESPIKVEIEKDLKEYMDITYLENVCKYGGLSLDQVLFIGEIVLKTILKLGIPSRDSIVKGHLDWLKKQTNAIDTIPELFKNILIEIEEIQKIIYIHKTKNYLNK